jgi:DNA-binding MarR family transcriptional regulator
VNQALGERFLQYRIKGDDPHEVARKARESAGRESLMRRELREAFGGFIDQFRNIQGESINIKLLPDIEEKIINLACLCARARTAVIRNRYTQAIEVLPESEGPSRLMKQFTNLGIALTLIKQKDTLDEEIYKILKRVGKDTLPALRTRMLEVLWSEGAYEELGGCWLKTKEIANTANLPTTTAKYKLEDLQSMNLVNREIREEDHEESDKKIPYKWQLSKECVQLLISTDFLIEENNIEEIPF